MRRKHFYFILILAIIASCSFGRVSSAFAVFGASSAEGLNISIEYAKGKNNIWAVIWLNIDAEYYTYAPTDVVDDSILPVDLAITNGQGAVFSVKYPLGIERQDFYDSTKVIQSYSGNTPIFVNLGAESLGAKFEGMLSLLLCSKEHCLPVKMPISLHVPSTMPKLSEQGYFDIWQGAELDKQENLTEINEASSANQHSVNLLNSSELSEDYIWAFSPRTFAEELEVSSFNKAILLGFLAGIILNLMPCVFPVLALKASSFLSARQGMQGNDFAEFRMQNLLFAAGMLSLFVLLAIFLGSSGLIWGQFYQDITFVVVMILLVFLLALSMFGVFNLPMFDLKAGNAKSPRAQAYFTGILTTILATPCSGPLLGGVLSWAFTQNLTILILVFVAVGLGMSTPYLILALRPQLAIFLPRPGVWMSMVEKFVAFFLLGTAVYLFSILPQYAYIPMLIGLVLISFMAWVWGYFGGLNASRLKRSMLGFVFIISMLLVVFFVIQPPTPMANWHDFNAASFKAELGKQPMLVEFTADWCPNCKFLEKTVLTADFMEEIQDDYDLKLVRVDITHKNAQAEALLHALGSSSIPLTAIFNIGLQSSTPIILRDIYTQDMLKEALEHVFE